MKKIFVYIFIGLGFSVHAADGLFKAGGRSAAMGNASLTSRDVWALFHNPAGIAFLKNAEAGISYEKRFSMKELSTNALAVGVPIGKSGTIGFNATYFGFKNYNENQLGLTYAMRFSNKISGAVKINYQSFNIGDEYGSHQMLTAELGFQAMVIHNLWLGAHLYNPTQGKLADDPNEQLPSVLSLGAGYLFSEKFNMEISAEKNSDEPTMIHTGIEYHPIKQFWLRAGMASQPFKSSFGFGLELDNFLFDFAAGFHPDLGFTPTLSLTYHFNKKQ